VKVINVRNVHDALPVAMLYLSEDGVGRDSRNGPVVSAPGPVATVYRRPWERVIFWPERDANPFLHLYEALWMLAGRNDIAPLLRYAPQFAQYSDDGVTQHAAYGHRWRNHFGKDQILYAVDRLRRSKTDRRVVIQMWDPRSDLQFDDHLKDVPCNLDMTLQIDDRGKLNMVVFCRSNDVIWGAYGANAVHMSVLQEYVARGVGVEMGSYHQVSVNFHAYDATSVKCWPLKQHAVRSVFTNKNPYDHVDPTPVGYDQGIVTDILDAADCGKSPMNFSRWTWAFVYAGVLHAHHLYKQDPESSMPWLEELEGQLLSRHDWVVAAKEWVQRRLDRAAEKREA
jgi:hypothetical protein